MDKKAKIPLFHIFDAVSPGGPGKGRAAWRHRAGRYAGGFFAFGLLTACLAVGLFFAFSGDRDAALLAGGKPASDLPTVVIDAGHGGEDSGAVGVNGVYEKDLNLEMARDLAALFGAAGYPVVLTRDEDKLLYTPEQNVKGQRKVYDLANRLRIAEAGENRVLVSLHMNSYPSPQCRGTQVWYSVSDPLSETLARSVQTRVAAWQTDNHRAVKPAGSDIYLLHRSTIPAILVECGFLTSPEECEKLCETDYRKELSFVIFCGMIEVLNGYGPNY